MNRSLARFEYLCLAIFWMRTVIQYWIPRIPRWSATNGIRWALSEQPSQAAVFHAFAGHSAHRTGYAEWPYGERQQHSWQP